MVTLTNQTTSTPSLTDVTLSTASQTNQTTNSASLSNQTVSTASMNNPGFGVKWQEATFTWAEGEAWSTYSDEISLTNV